MQGPSPPHAIRTKRQSPNTIKTNTSVVSSQHPYPEYPIVIPPEKLTKALALYNAFKLEEHLAGHNAHRGAYLIPSVSGSSRDSNHSLSPSLEEVSRQTDYGSVVSFSQSPQKVKPELTTFDGKVVKARQRKRLSPMARAKAALIRYLGSCQPCRNRRMPCPLGHHDIERLETLRWTSELARAETEFEDSVPLDVHSDIMNRHNSQPDVLLGLGQNPELLQDINNSSRDDIELPPATKIHAPPGAKFGHQSHHPIESTSIPGQPFLRVETSVPSPHNSTSSETSSNHVEKHFAQMGLDTVDNSKHETPSVTESLRTESGFNAGSSSNNLATEIAAAVEASYEAAYGPGPALPSLLSKLQSIFNDGTFESSESIFKLQDTTCNDGASQHVGASKEAPACGDQNYNTSGSPTTFLGTGSRPGNDLLDRRTKGSSRVKTAKSNAKPSVRVLRRLRCHFNARHPRKYCVTRSTGDKYHVCSKSGYLTIAHLKYVSTLSFPEALLTTFRQHNKSTHTVSRCTRCGGLFGSSEKMGEHSRAYPACDPVLPDQWPGIDQAENINETIQERITINLTARGYQQLPQTTKDALNIWVSANITEYVSDSPTPQDLLELKNWYLIWLALFPGIVVPTHPCKPQIAFAPICHAYFVKFATGHPSPQRKMGDFLRSSKP